MTEILTLRMAEGPPTIVRAFQFDPWPFEDEIVNLDSCWYLDNEGTLEDIGLEVGLDANSDNVLVLLSDGRIAAASAQGVRAYGRPSPP
jgi:hypothetical protein